MITSTASKLKEHSKSDYPNACTPIVSISELRRQVLLLLQPWIANIRTSIWAIVHTSHMQRSQKSSGRFGFSCRSTLVSEKRLCPLTRAQPVGTKFRGHHSSDFGTINGSRV
jgi:hypothetical protein